MVGKNKRKNSSLPGLGQTPFSTPAIQRRSVSYSGPLPPPEMLEKYHKMDSTLVDRIIAMAEIEQEHRHGQESKASEVILIESNQAKDKIDAEFALAVSDNKVKVCLSLIAALVLVAMFILIYLTGYNKTLVGGVAAVLCATFGITYMNKSSEPSD